MDEDIVVTVISAGLGFLIYLIKRKQPNWFRQSLVEASLEKFLFVVQLSYC